MAKPESRIAALRRVLLGQGFGRSLRKLLVELATIVLGVVIGLAASEYVADWQSREKVRALQEAMDEEVRIDLNFALELRDAEPCIKRYLDRLEAATLRRESAAVRELLSVRAPFRARPWRTVTWQATLSSSIAEQIGRERFESYAFFFTLVTAQRDRQLRVFDEMPEAVAGRYELPADPAATRRALIAIAQVRSILALSTGVAGQLAEIAERRLGIDAVYSGPIPAGAVRCEASAPGADRQAATTPQ